MADKITREVAEQEVARWMDYKRLSPKRREDNKDNIETITSAVQDGILVLNDDNSWTHKLIFPLGEEKEAKGFVNELKYQPRMNSVMLKPFLQGVKSTDSDDRLHAHIACLTKQSRAIIAALDSEDKRIAQAIMLFFL